MHDSTTGFFDRSPHRTSFGFSTYAAGFSLIWLLWSILYNAQAYNNFEHGFALLATFGAMGCLGYLAAYAYRGPEYLFSVFSLSGGTDSLEAHRTSDVLVASADWPLLVALLFGPFSMLLAGLGGWV
ncbi:hypothetical protein BH23ACT11_BH23ACT11_18530 [soil metagenome]